jgi:archaeal type IV pilus assembly protein PilA
MKRIAKSTKALSPVVASIILIAVTVAVSIAVAVWMGALTTGFMQTEQAQIVGVNFGGSGANITLSVTNTGTNSLTLTSATVNGATAAITGAPQTIAGNTQGASVVLTSAWASGNAYTIKLVSSKGNTFTYVANAP